MIDILIIAGTWVAVVATLNTIDALLGNIKWWTTDK